MVYAVKGRVRGRVQGVGFRVYVRELALEKGLSGWAKNLSDGSVEVLLKGNREDVNEVQHKVSLGPQGSDVRSLAWELLADAPEDDFVIGTG